MKKNKKIRSFWRKAGLCSLLLAGAILYFNGNVSQARRIGYMSGFTVYYGTGVKDEKFTDAIPKAVTNRDAVVNLAEDSGTAWITCTVRNSDNASRGSTNLQRGTRKEFACTGQAYYNYKLGVRKKNNTGGGKVTINGSWSPDNK